MIKLVSANYYEECGTSVVEIMTELGKFKGVAELHEDDKDIASHFIGCEIAEYRATIQYFKKLLYRLNIEIKLLEKLPYSKENFKVYEQKKNHKKEVLDNISSLKDIINNKLENRLVILKEIEKIQQKRKEDK